jgi:hypothetical protein
MITTIKDAQIHINGVIRRQRYESFQTKKRLGYRIIETIKNNRFRARSKYGFYVILIANGDLMSIKTRQTGFLFLVLAFHVLTVLRAQDPYLQKDDELAEAQATTLMKMYQDDLGMTVDQALQFRAKATEFMIRHNEIQKERLPASEKLKLLRELSRQETAEMANILTQPQYRLYRKLKKSYQPIAVVVGEVETP